MSHGAPKVGIRNRVAYALAVFPLDEVSREALRALLPKGLPKRRPPPLPSKAAANFQRGVQTHAAGDTVSDRVSKALSRFEKNGWILRRQLPTRHAFRTDNFVDILNRDALWEDAFRAGQQEIKGKPEHFLLLDQAIGQIRDEIAELEVERSLVRLLERRRQELLALQRLMIDVRNDNWSGRGSVRFVPRSRVL